MTSMERISLKGARVFAVATVAVTSYFGGVAISEGIAAHDTYIKNQTTAELKQRAGDADAREWYASADSEKDISDKQLLAGLGIFAVSAVGLIFTFNITKENKTVGDVVHRYQDDLVAVQPDQL